MYHPLSFSVPLLCVSRTLELILPPHCSSSTLQGLGRSSFGPEAEKGGREPHNPSVYYPLEILGLRGGNKGKKHPKKGFFFLLLLSIFEGEVPEI